MTQSVKPLGSQLSKGTKSLTKVYYVSIGFGQAQQMAKEKMGATDVTELPLEYRQMETKIENAKLVHELFLKVSKNYTLPFYGNIG